MSRVSILRHVFVEHIPERLERGTIYVSIVYATVVHRCCCGCGEEVVTPLSPTDWRLEFDGESISLHPSIGNWSFPCRSHYWIEKNRVTWARRWTSREIDAGRAAERQDKARYLGEPSASPAHAPPAAEARTETSLWDRIRAWFSSDS
jgi:Family of unknown function (DUF6527)